MPFRDASTELAGCVLTLVLPVYACVALRFYVRKCMIGRIGPDDWCMLAASIFFAGLTAISLAGAWDGLGVHEWDLTAEETVRAYMWFTLASFLFFATILCTKLAIGLALCRVATGRRGYIYPLYACLTLFTTVIITSSVYLGLHCRPFAYNWDKDIPDGTCRNPFNIVIVYYTVSITNITTNWFCAILPIPLLWNVQMDRRNKISVLACLSLGFFASIAALIRLRYISSISNQIDFLYKVINVCIWAFAEVGIGIFAGSMATLRPLLDRIFKKRSYSRGSLRPTRQPTSIITIPHEHAPRISRHRGSVAPRTISNVEAGSTQSESIAGTTITADENVNPKQEHGGIMVSYGVRIAHGDAESQTSEGRKTSEPGW